MPGIGEGGAVVAELSIRVCRPSGVSTSSVARDMRRSRPPEAQSCLPPPLAVMRFVNSCLERFRTELASPRLSKAINGEDCGAKIEAS